MNNDGRKAIEMDNHALRRAHRLHQGAISLLALQAALNLHQGPLGWAAALLVLMAILKLRESRTRSDLQRVAITEWITTGLLAVLRPELGPSLMQGLSTALILAALLTQEGDRQASLGQSVAHSLQMILGALPALVLLCLLLPRLGPLWSPSGNATGRTGIDASLEPGSISKLIQDSSPALTISWINGTPPPPQQRYWRVLILDRFDGQRWTRSPASPQSKQHRPPLLERTPDELWVAEPSPVQAVPWAGRGKPIDPGFDVTPDGVLTSAMSGKSRRIYRITNNAGNLPWPSVRPQSGDLSYPTGSNPQLESLAKRWRERPVMERIRAARDLFIDSKLRYTLNPPPATRAGTVGRTIL